MIKKFLNFSLECEYEPHGSNSKINIRNLSYSDLVNIASNINKTCLTKITINYATKDLLEYVVKKSSAEIDLQYTDIISTNISKLKTSFFNSINLNKIKTLFGNITEQNKSITLTEKDLNLLYNEFKSYWIQNIAISNQISLTGTLIIDFAVLPITDFEKVFNNSLNNLIETIEKIIIDQIKNLKHN